jgi:ribose transport system permease protein
VTADQAKKGGASMAMELNPAPARSPSAALRTLLSYKETSVALIILAISLLLGLLSPYFFTASNLMTALMGMSSDGIVVVGVTVVLVLGGLDLSVGSILGLACMTAAYLALHGVNIWLASLVAMGVGALCGYINGLFIGKVGLNPFITTLAMLGIGKGLTLLATQGASVSLTADVPPSFVALGEGHLFGVPVLVVIFVAVAVVGDFLLRRSEPFRKVFYIGSNENAARLSGINVTKVKMAVYVLTASLSALAGVLSLARFGASTPTTGAGTELRAISAAVIGGASLNGGEGSIVGAVLGVILINLVNDGLVLLNVSVYGQDLITGLILLLAVTIDHVGHMRRMKRVKH